MSMAQTITQSPECVDIQHDIDDNLNPYPGFRRHITTSLHPMERSIGPQRIRTMGESAGFHPAARIILMLHKRGLSTPVAKPSLDDPMLDDHKTESISRGHAL